MLNMMCCIIPEHKSFPLAIVFSETILWGAASWDAWTRPSCQKSLLYRTGEVGLELSTIAVSFHDDLNIHDEQQGADLQR